MREIKTYRKRPIEIKAIQWDGTAETTDAIMAWNSKIGLRTSTVHLFPAHLVIPTLEGEMIANVGDYIIRGIQGEFYPCKSDIFDASYEEVTNDR